MNNDVPRDQHTTVNIIDITPVLTLERYAETATRRRTINKYNVTVRAFITKDVEVIAKDEADAIGQAREHFSVLDDGGDENYEQYTLFIEKDKTN